MEDVLDLYAEPYERPVVCFDETSKQLLSEKRSPIPAKAGRERFDYEYQRNGTRLVHDAGLEARGRTGRRSGQMAGWRTLLTPERRRSGGADNLNTHRPASLYVDRRRRPDG